MEAHRALDFPYGGMDKRPRKRPRLTWDMPPVMPPPAPSKILPAAYCAQEFGVVSNYEYSSIYYKRITGVGSPPWRPDDKDGHYVFALGENLTPRYRILSKIGEGTFGKVLECIDNERTEIVAIKVVRSIQKYQEAAMIEIDILQKLVKYDTREYIKVPDYKFLSRSGKDGLYFKNIPKSSAIKLIDFGSTTYEQQDHSYVVSTRHYRAPEVILGLGWSYSCDMWSVGCILVELCSGEALFQTHENLEHLAMMEKVLGPLPQHMIARADRRAERYFRRGARLDWPEGATSRESIKAVWKLPRLQNLIMHHVDHSAGDLIDLLQRLLRHEPTERLKAREALGHPFFTRDLRRFGCSL